MKKECSRFHAKETGLGASVVISLSNQVSINIIWGAKTALYVVPNTWKKRNVMSRHEGDPWPLRAKGLIVLVSRN